MGEKIMGKYDHMEMEELMRIKRKLESYQEDFNRFSTEYVIRTEDCEKTKLMFSNRLDEINAYLEEYRLYLENVAKMSPVEKNTKRKKR